MTPTFNPVRDRRINWRRELPPVLVVAGLAADYLSPPALWTMLLPFGFVVMLIALRKWAHAAAVFLLCSWVLLPTAAHFAASFEDAQGDHPLYVTDGATLPPVDELADSCVLRNVRFEVLPVGPGHLVNPRWVLRHVVTDFVDLHNVLVIDRLLDDGADLCRAPVQQK